MAEKNVDRKVFGRKSFWSIFFSDEHKSLPTGSDLSAGSDPRGGRSRFFKIISKNLPLKGKFFEMVSRALPPGGVWGAWPPRNLRSLHVPCLRSGRALPPCLAPNFFSSEIFSSEFFHRNFFVGIFSSDFFSCVRPSSVRPSVVRPSFSIP